MGVGDAQNIDLPRRTPPTFQPFQVSPEQLCRKPKLGSSWSQEKQRFIGGDDLGLFPEHLGHLGQKVLSCVVVVSLVST